MPCKYFAEKLSGQNQYSQVNWLIHATLTWTTITVITIQTQWVVKRCVYQVWTSNHSVTGMWHIHFASQCFVYRSEVCTLQVCVPSWLIMRYFAVKFILSNKKKYEIRAKLSRFYYILPKHSSNFIKSWQTPFSITIWKLKEMCVICSWIAIELHINDLSGPKSFQSGFQCYLKNQCSTNMLKILMGISQSNHFALQCVENLVNFIKLLKQYYEMWWERTIITFHSVFIINLCNDLCCRRMLRPQCIHARYFA